MVKIKLPISFFDKESFEDILLYKWAYTLLPDKQFYNILDANCSDGKNVERLLKKYPNARIAGISNQDEDVEKTIKLNKIAIQNHRSEICKVKLANLPYRNTVFDLVMLFSKEPNQEELNEINRVMKKDACLIIAGKVDSEKIKDLLESLANTNFTSISLAEEEEYGRYAILAHKK